MKGQRGLKLYLLFGLCVGLLGLCLLSSVFAQGVGQERKIVVFQERYVNAAAQEALLRVFGGVAIKPLPLINGWAVYLPAPAVGALQRRGEIKRIDPDVVVYAIEEEGAGCAAAAKAKPSPPPQPAQIIPWGIERVLAPSAWGISMGAGVKVAILDTGIDLDHPDLRANIAGGVNTISPRKTAEDDNGHGTHVAGIVAAVNNTIGVVGVAPQAKLYAIKALDRTGSGYLSDIIEGLQWCVANRMQVVNMSLGTTYNVPSFADAVKAVNNAGIVQVAAAGNSGGATNYPAAYPEVISVAATDINNVRASWSCYGKIDLAAPGVNIYSTYKGDSYATMSGTSMASPHVAGVVALRLARYPGDSPAAVLFALQTAALDLGDVGWDIYYGAGLVQAPGAIQ